MVFESVTLTRAVTISPGVLPPPPELHVSPSKLEFFLPVCLSGHLFFPVPWQSCQAADERQVRPQSALGFTGNEKTFEIFQVRIPRPSGECTFQVCAQFTAQLTLIRFLIPSRLYEVAPLSEEELNQVSLHHYTRTQRGNPALLEGNGNAHLSSGLQEALNTQPASDAPSSSANVRDHFLHTSQGRKDV